MIEARLREKISANLQPVMKGLQLYDYNMDGKVARQELRKVLENCCFKFTDDQFDKLWQSYDFHHTGFINYRDFLRWLGVSVNHSGSVTPKNTAIRVFKWPDIGHQSKVVTSQLKKCQEVEQKLMQTLDYEQIETEFRKRMRINYLKLKKAFMAFDKHKDGFVSIENLKSILNNFTLPMSDQIFLHLMDRCDVKASGRVAWEIFLEKFQNPVAVGNGKTLPIRPNYRIHPSVETQTTMDSEAIWKQLYKRVQTQFSSLKEAFLQMDKNRDGRVTKREFRELIEKFTFRLDDHQFKELMLKIDPDKNNNVDYHTFLRLFEERETKEGHKWLKSVHKYRKSKHPVLAWKTVEELLQEKITYYWKDVSDWLKYYDSGGTGYLSKGTLKKIINLQVLPVSDEHFESLISRCTDFLGGKINYMEFMARLGVDVKPGDVDGLSTQITDGSSRAELKRQLDQIQRHDQITLNQYYRSSHMTADEVITLFKDKIVQLKYALRKSFLKNVKQNKEQISRTQFRTILADLGILMTDDQFSELMSRLSLHNGYMQYMDFVLNFGDSRHQNGSMRVVEHLNNHRVNPIHGDEGSMTAVEAETKLRQKLRENFSNLRGAFYKFDSLHQGYLDKSSFRRLLDSFMIIMSDVEYDKFCDNLGIMKDSKISYLEFLERFEHRDFPEGHKWLNSVHRFNETLQPKPLTATEAHTLLALKVHRQWNDLSKAFRSMDSKGKGIITKQDLRETLYKFVMPMEPTEFQQLWARLDTENKNFISHQDFLQRLGAQEYAPVDTGPSSRIFNANYQFLKNHSLKQHEKHEEITWNQVNLTMNMPVALIERQLRDKIRDSYSDFYTAFRKYDTSRRGVLSAYDIQKVLNEQHIFVNDELFSALLNRIGLASYGSCINYSEFLSAFEDGRKSSYGYQAQDIKIEKYQMLNPEDAEKKLKMKLSTNINDVVKALTAFDKDGSGKVQLSDFRSVLDMFCFALTDPQWQHIKTGLNMTADHCVEYNDFLSQFITSETDNNGQHFQFMLSDSPMNSASPVIDDREKIQKAVFLHYHNILRDFESFDLSKSGCVTVEEFRDVIDKHVLKLSDEQFEKLRAVCSVSEQNNVDYKQFLKMFSEDMPLMFEPTPLPPTDRAQSQMMSVGPTRPSTSRSIRPGSRRSRSSSSYMSQSSLRSSSRISTPMVNAESAERMVKDKVFRYWREMQKQCRNMDVDNSGTITVQQFNDLLSHFGVLLSAPDFNDLATKYDIFENGSFCYSDFIRHFLLAMKPSDTRSLTSREKLPNKKLYNQEAPIQEVEENYDFLRRTQDCVHQNWKEMGREFRKVDPESQGKVPTDEFRRVLRKFNINMSESEFHLLQDKHDPDFSDQISYNDFLKDYIH